MSRENLESIYPLTFVQEALLLHHLYQPESNIGFIQVCCTISQNIDTLKFKQAWQEVIDAHPVLRTSLHWEDIAKPVQLVKKSVSVDLEEIDLEEFPDDVHQIKIQKFIEAEQLRGFDFRVAPIMRVKLIRSNENLYNVIWSAHHLILDGWSWSLLFDEVFGRYKAKVENINYKNIDSPPFKQYLNWLKSQDDVEANFFWSEALEQMGNTRLLPSGNASADFGQFRIDLSELSTSKINDFAKAHKITLNTVMQGSWAILLSQLTDRDVAVFGQTVLGRSINLPGVETMMGVLTNSIPVCLPIDFEEQVSTWLKKIFRSQSNSKKHEQFSLHQILEWGGHKSSSDIFDSLLIFQNFNPNDFSRHLEGKMDVKITAQGTGSSFPLTLMIAPEKEIILHITHDKGKFSSNIVRLIIERYRQIIESIINHPNSTLNEFLAQEAQSEVLSRLKEEIIEWGDSRETGTHDSDQDNFIPPRNQTELILTGIWEEVFGFQPIGIDDNFFEIGGKSVMAVQLFSKIETKIGKNLPPITLLQHPTISNLAKLINGEDCQSEWNSLVPLRATGTKPPLFCIHAGGGHVFFYQGLAKYLGYDQPIYALEPLGLDGETVLHTTIEEMATHYLSEIKSIQPQGPYNFISICYGNPISLEMGRQLRNANQDVSFLGIVDSAPGTIFYPPKHPGLGERIIRFLGRVGKSPFSTITGMMVRRIGWLNDSQETKHKGLNQTLQEKNFNIWQETMINAYNSYSWAPYAGEVTLIRTKESVKNPLFKIHVSIWERLAEGGLDVKIIEGHHTTIFDEPEVKNLADVVSQCLEKINQPV